MNLFAVLNEEFHSIYSEIEMENNKITVTSEDVEKIVNIAQISLPIMLRGILEEGVIYGFEIENTPIMINFDDALTIQNINNNYPGFKEDVPKGLIFASDLGDGIYYYGDGKQGLGLYVADAGAGDYYEEATKFANSFDDFFIKGIGIDILKIYYNI